MTLKGKQILVFAVSALAGILAFGAAKTFVAGQMTGNMGAFVGGVVGGVAAIIVFFGVSKGLSKVLKITGPKL